MIIFVFITPLARGQALQTLYSFTGLRGAYPRSELVQGIDGNFNGTVEVGGANNENGYGTVFKVAASGASTRWEFVWHNFFWRSDWGRLRDRL